MHKLIRVFCWWILSVLAATTSAAQSADSVLTPPTAPEPSIPSEIVFAGEQRFRNNEDGTVTDLTTGLMWMLNGNIADMKMPLQVAKKWINRINTGDVENFGYHDWRIPSIQEFQSLVDKTQNAPALSVGHPFKNVQNGYYWTSSGGFNIVEYVWVMDLTYGLVKFDYPSYCNFQSLWPVRDAK